MKVVTPHEMATMDKNTIAEGISGLALMERAGIACTEVIKNTVKPENGTVLIVCGIGNNGGDGQVIAHHLHEAGYEISIFFTGDASRMTPDSLANFKRVQEDKIPFICMKEGDPLNDLKEAASHAVVIVDAIFGTGLRDRPLKSWLCSVVECINETKATVIAIDIPSGLRGDIGVAAGQAVCADKTIVIQNYKTGCLLNDGPDKTGEMIRVDIGIREDTIDNHKYLTRRKDIQFPVQRRKNSHKYDYGAVAVVAGSKGMIGAGLLAMEGALKSGAGLVTGYVPDDIYALVAARASEEVMIQPVTNSINYQTLSNRKDVILFGPGVGRKQDYSAFLTEALSHDVPLVIDADGLFHLTARLDVLEASHTPVVLTPHLGEFSHMIGVDKQEICQDPIAYVRRFAKTYGVVLVLKGYRTMVINPDGDVWFNSTGNPGMATAGSGDVLAGMIAGIAGQTKNMFEAARAGVYYHGAAGDDYAQKYGETTLTARNIIDSLQYVITTGE